MGVGGGSTLIPRKNDDLEEEYAFCTTHTWPRRRGIGLSLPYPDAMGRDIKTGTRDSWLLARQFSQGGRSPD